MGFRCFAVGKISRNLSYRARVEQNPDSICLRSNEERGATVRQQTATACEIKESRANES